MFHLRGSIYSIRFSSSRDKEMKHVSDRGHTLLNLIDFSGSLSTTKWSISRVNEQFLTLTAGLDTPHPRPHYQTGQFKPYLIFISFIYLCCYIDSRQHIISSDNNFVSVCLSFCNYLLQVVKVEVFALPPPPFHACVCPKVIR